jgi:hypothetical protein
MWDARPHKLDEPNWSTEYTLQDLALSLEEVSTAARLAAHIIPAPLLATDLRASAGNRMMVASSLQDSSEDVLAQVIFIAHAALEERSTGREAAASHLMEDDACEALLKGEFAQFVELRHATVERRTEQFLLARGEWGYEATPALSSLVVDEDEVRDDEADDVT